MGYLIFGVVILAAAVGCRTNVILIDGVPTERTQFCVGEELTLLCQNSTTAYEWEYPGGSIPVSRANAMRIDNGFTVVYVNTTTTTFQFVVSSDMNGITITCSNFIEGNNISATNLKVLGMSSMMCPAAISAVAMNNCSSVDVSLRDVSRCTREYSASISGETEVISSVLSETDRGAEVLDLGSFTLTNPSLESCNTYNVAINVTFFNNSRMTCPSVAVELPTNSAPTATSIPITTPSSTVAPASIATRTDSTTTTSPSPDPSLGGGPPIAIIVAVVVVGCAVIVITIIITIIIVICVNRNKNRRRKNLESTEMHNGDAQQTTESTYAVLDLHNSSSYSRQPHADHGADEQDNGTVVYSTLENTTMKQC